MWALAVCAWISVSVAHAALLGRGVLGRRGGLAGRGSGDELEGFVSALEAVFERERRRSFAGKDLVDGGRAEAAGV
jgi:hypothetical protein